MSEPLPPEPLASLDWRSAVRVGETQGLASRLWRIGDLLVKQALRPADATKEAAFYERWAPLTGLPLPRLHLHHEDWLVLDWIDGAPGDCLVGATSRQAASVADTLHALVRVAAGDHAPEGLRNVLPEPDSLATRVEASLSHVGRHFAEHASLVHALPARVAAAVTRLRARPGALCHADFHVENLLFRGDQAIVIDWPSFGWAPRGIDVTRFVIEGLEDPTRWREWAPHAVDEVPDAALMSLGFATASGWMARDVLEGRPRALLERLLRGLALLTK